MKFPKLSAFGTAVVLTILTLALFATAAIVSGCAKDGTYTPVQGAKEDFDVQFLFEKDGVKVYRFLDNGHYHYFTSDGETMTHQSAGKTSYPENIR